MGWKRARTGMRFVDAALREMYVTGTMHNRGRMIAASYPTKHLMCHWKIGLKWSGSGPDATSYFRVFNPETQLDKFDPDRTYVGRWIDEGKPNPNADALKYFDAIPGGWAMSPEDKYPAPIVTAEEGRKRALAAYEARGF